MTGRGQSHERQTRQASWVDSDVKILKFSFENLNTDKARFNTKIGQCLVDVDNDGSSIAVQTVPTVCSVGSLDKRVAKQAVMATGNDSLYSCAITLPATATEACTPVAGKLSLLFAFCISPGLNFWQIGMLSFLIVCLPSSLAEPFYNTTSQQLPSECWYGIKELNGLKECPYQLTEYDKEVWTQLNATCCVNFPGTALHCQQAEHQGFVSWVFFSCLATQMVSRGLSVKLEENDGKPGLRVFMDCPGWDDEVRPSYTIREPCDHINTRIDCSPEKGRKKLCSGGAADDLCVCDPNGYEPYGFSDGTAQVACLQGFGSNDPSCLCQSKPCPVGYFRNIAIPIMQAACVTVELSVLNYTCVATESGTTGAPALPADRPMSTVTRQPDTATKSIVTQTKSSMVPQDGFGGHRKFWVYCGVVLVVSVGVAIIWHFRVRLLHFCRAGTCEGVNSQPEQHDSLAPASGSDDTLLGKKTFDVVIDYED